MFSNQKNTFVKYLENFFIVSLLGETITSGAINTFKGGG